MKASVFKYSPVVCEVQQVELSVCHDFLLENSFIYWFDFEGKPDQDLFCGFIKHIIPSIEINVNKLISSELSHFDDHKDWAAVTLKMMDYDSKENKINYEAITLVLIKNVVISIQSDILGDHFEEIRDKIKSMKSSLNQRNAEYLFVRLIESIEANYHKIINEINEDLLEIEAFIPKATNITELKSLFMIKRELLFLRKNTSPLRDTLFQMLNSEEYQFSKPNQKQIKTIYERLIYVVDNIDLNRDMLSGMLDFHISSNGYKMNNIMKVLTTISTIFMPLGFLAGYYGMNFQNLPLLNEPYGYLWVTLVMLGIGMSMFVMFKRRRWI